LEGALRTVIAWQSYQAVKTALSGCGARTKSGTTGVTFERLVREALEGEALSAIGR
jgi:hypothetical protein